MNKSGIEWLRNPDGSNGLTVNPVIGCTRISPGCGGGHIKGPNGEQGGCWAEELVSTRMSKNPGLPMYHDLARPDGGWSGVVKLVPERLQEIVALGRARKRNAEKKLVPYGSRVFVCDLSDLFHEKVPFEYIAAVFGAMACAPRSLFYVLTKRADRAVEFIQWLAAWQDCEGEFHPPTRILAAYLNQYAETRIWSDTADEWEWPLPNVAMGVTVEDRRYGVPRLDLLRKFPAKYRWASVEPQLEDLGEVDFSGFDLIVCGGESGDGARRFDLQWARNVRDCARKAGAAFFMKQLGDAAVEHGAELTLFRKGNDIARFPKDLQIRENLQLPRVSA